MSDTADHPTPRAPEPTAELWGIYDHHADRWFDTSDVELHPSVDVVLAFTSREKAQAEIDSWDEDSSPGCVPHRLIPPTP